MVIDLSQFYQVFFEEAGEHLANMESLLLGLDVAQPDGEELNAIFRAAHSIKGSAGTFGFSDMAEVTHVLENLLDRLRKGELALREEMIDAFLAAGDALKGLLAAHKGEGAADPATVEATCARLRALTAGPVLVPAAAPAADLPAGDRWLDLYFVLDGDAAAADRALDCLLAELGRLGEARLTGGAAAAGQPRHIAYRGAADPDTLRAALEFVARSDSIRIAPAGAPALADAEDGSYGFFDTAPTAAAGEAYGLFEPLPAAAGDGGDGYGFFEPLPAVAPAHESPDGAYGLFVDLPPVTEAPPPAAAVPAAAVPAADRPRPAAAPGGGETTIRVGVDKVDQLINLVGELVITQAMLLQAAGGLDPVQFERLHSGLAQLERNSRDLQEAAMSIRMLPISVVFSRFPRVVRELSQKLGKKVELRLVGEGTELDKSLIERITDPLTHLVRNSLDHGVELPEERAARGKQPVGTVTLRAYHQSGNIVIEVGDDGAGLNRQKILAKARQHGLPVSEQMSDQEVWQLIFEAGFSTADQVTEVSGRGVGMDVVRRNIHAMGGRVEIESMTGVGTRMTVRLPLTLAILDGMSVAVGRETYILPLGYVIESLQADPGMVRSISGVRRLLQVRGEYLPVIVLHEVFGMAGAPASFERGIMVVVEADGARAALFVDALLGQQQVVIKSLEANYRKVAGVSGATIMGDGHVALILDVAVLAALGRSAATAAV